MLHAENAASPFRMLAQPRGRVIIYEGRIRRQEKRKREREREREGEREREREDVHECKTDDTDVRGH